MVSLVGVTSLKGCSTLKRNNTVNGITVPITGDVIFLAIGQSNMAGRATYTTGAKFPTNVQQYSQAGAFESVYNRTNLEHHDDVNNQYYGGKLSICVNFAIDFQAANPDANLIFVPHASGGTSFITNRWNQGDDLYTGAVSRINAALAAKPDALFGGILFHMVETDTVNNNTGFEADLDAFISALRTDITEGNSTTPFVSGNSTSGFVSGYGNGTVVNNAVVNIAARNDYAANASASDLTLQDTYHFNEASVRTLGSRYYTSWALAASNQ